MDFNLSNLRFSNVVFRKFRRRFLIYDLFIILVVLITTVLDEHSRHYRNNSTYIETDCGPIKTEDKAFQLFLVFFRKPHHHVPQEIPGNMLDPPTSYAQAAGVK